MAHTIAQPALRRRLCWTSTSQSGSPQGDTMKPDGGWRRVYLGSNPKLVYSEKWLHRRRNSIIFSCMFTTTNPHQHTGACKPSTRMTDISSRSSRCCGLLAARLSVVANENTTFLSETTIPLSSCLADDDCVLAGCFLLCFLCTFSPPWCTKPECNQRSSPMGARLVKLDSL